MTNPSPPFFTYFSIKGLLTEARQKLADVSDSAALDAELLLAECLGKSQAYLHTWPEKNVTARQKECFQKLIQKRLEDYPVAYILGKKAFWTLDLRVTTDVLVPRPETELLVETALQKISNTEKPQILDLGTGSGAIALAIASERPDAMVCASDSSQAALKIAEYNARKNGLDAQLRFIQSNWFSNIKPQRFDLIVSNPPYIAPDDPHLQGSIRHEPQLALTAASSGMADIELIIANAPDFLKTNAWIILEHGYDQAKKTQQLFSQHHYKEIESRKDLNNLLRITLACRI